MGLIFFLIRLPFFVIGLWIWIAIGFVALDIGFILVALSLLGVVLWLVILLPGAIACAAFSNDTNVIAKFLAWSSELVVDAARFVREITLDYFWGYKGLWNWLLAMKAV